ncbi:MAG: hypothetical protein WD398_08515 [Cyclobacteriaceae bacterium]
MKKLTSYFKSLLVALFFCLVQVHDLIAQASEEAPGEHPLDPSPYRIVFYILISFIVIAVVFKLLYRPGKKNNPK